MKAPQRSSNDPVGPSRHPLTDQNERQITLQSNTDIPHRKELEAQLALTLPPPPPESEHPAYYAPFADDTASLPHYSSKRVTQTPTGPILGSSSEPLATKADISAENPASPVPTISAAPNSSSLQNPGSFHFSPIVETYNSRAVPLGSIGIHQPGQISHPNQEVKGGTWTYGLCNCPGMSTCCLGLLCPCILYGRTQYRLSMKSKREDPTNLLGYSVCNGSCVNMVVLCGCQCLLATIQHTRVRRTYAINGNIATDFVSATCCTSCTLIQDEKEIRKREEARTNALVAAGAVFVPPYMSPSQMTYTTS